MCEIIEIKVAVMSLNFTGHIRVLFVPAADHTGSTCLHCLFLLLPFPRLSFFVSSHRSFFILVPVDFIGACCNTTFVLKVTRSLGEVILCPKELELKSTTQMFVAFSSSCVRQEKGI